MLGASQPAVVIAEEISEGVMNTSRKTKKAAAKAAGKTNENLAHAWLAWSNGTETDGAFRRQVAKALRPVVMARALRQRSKLPPEMVEDIAQDAAVLLVGRYLAGNEGLAEATANRDFGANGQEPEHSLLGALEVAVKRAMRKAGREADRHALLAEAAEKGNLPDAAEANYRLPFEQQLRLALSALDQAMGQRLLPQAQGALLREILDGKPPANGACRRRRSATRSRRRPSASAA